ncbi:hypothetical protein PG985_008461 [Apiospora marii]|uniref:uncharacterized protein n=1 Tax=Apiospora marii TaxID=335849 RepID=UPI0031326355
MQSDNSGFAALKPAIITKVNVDVTKIHPFGPSSNGSTLTHFLERRNMDPLYAKHVKPGQEVPSGTVETVPGFEPAFKAVVTFGGDWFSMDADGKHGRVNFRGIAQTEDGQQIDVRTFGIIDTSNPAASKTWPRSLLVTQVCFAADYSAYLEISMTGELIYTTVARTEYLVSDPKLKFLESTMLVGNARVIVDQTGVTIENRQSIVVATAVDE